MEVKQANNWASEQMLARLLLGARVVELEVLGVLERHNAVGRHGLVLLGVGTADPADFHIATTLGIQLTIGQQHGATDELATVLITHRAHIVDCPQLVGRNTINAKIGGITANGDFDLEVSRLGVLGELELGDVLGTKYGAQGVEEL